MSLTQGLLAAALAAFALRLAWSSRTWPLIHDAPLMHYIAWRIEHGAVPYRDVFDMNAPGPYLIHLLLLRTFGAGDLAWRIFDLGWLALTCGALALYARPFGAGPAAIAAGVFALYHLAGGVWLAGQRDFLLCVCLVVGAHLVASPAVWWRLILAGVVLGAGIALKPPAAVFLLVLTVAAAVAAARAGRAWWPPAVAVAAGGTVVPLACLAWLAGAGGLGAFIAIMVEYDLPLYSRLARVSPWTALGWWPFGWRVWALFAVLVAVAGGTVRSADRRRVLVFAGVAYGVVHFAVQGKGWEYQLYPLAAFACLAAGLAVAAPAPAVRWVAVVAAAALGLQLHAKGLQEHWPAWIAAKAERVDRIVQDLAGRLRPADTVQVLDTGEGGIHALLRLGVREPTRFIYDFHFFHDEDRVAIQRLRAEFLRGLQAAPPRFIVVLERGWPAGGYDRVERFPALATWIGATYRLDREGEGYRIYAKRADP
jgi:hypothetical protein